MIVTANNNITIYCSSAQFKNLLIAFKEMSVKAARRFYRVDSAHDLRFQDGVETALAENLWTFEVAWEVANKGISSCSPDYVVC